MTLVSTPRLTIGIPVYNGVNTIKETLDCCAKLSGDLIQVVVSDNCSTDGTFALVQSVSERCPNISVFRHEQNVGAANNFKFLLDGCRTEYFMWLGADDVCAPSLNLAAVERLFQQYPQAMAVSPFAMVGEVDAQVPDRGNRSLVNSRAENTLSFLLRPGVNSRFYSIYRTERLRNLFARMSGLGNEGYFASDITFSVAVLREGEWPMEPAFVLSRKPGISADGWQLRKSLSRSWLGAAFPSVRFIREIVDMAQPIHKIPVLMVASILYVRYLIGPIRHRLAKMLKLGKKQR
jgi:glycosyltransferase involved in cell wall biosynthesis